MTTIKELALQGIAEPAYLEIECNSKGYNYKAHFYGETWEETFRTMQKARKDIEIELYGTNPDAHPV